MTELRYKGRVPVEDLAIGECTVHRAGNDSGAKWWLLWFRVEREDGGGPIDVAVAINPNGDYMENGPGGRTWGLTRVYVPAGAWQVSPSINVLADQVHPGPHASPSMWHQTPFIVDVPADAAWATEPP